MKGTLEEVMHSMESIGFKGAFFAFLVAKKRLLYLKKNHAILNKSKLISIEIRYS